MIQVKERVKIFF